MEVGVVSVAPRARGVRSNVDHAATPLAMLRGEEAACSQHGKAPAAASRLELCGPCRVVSKAQHLALSRRARGPEPRRGSRGRCACQCSCRDCPAGTTPQDHRPPAACRRGARAPAPARTLFMRPSTDSGWTWCAGTWRASRGAVWKVRAILTRALSAGHHGCDRPRAAARCSAAISRLPGCRTR